MRRRSENGKGGEPELRKAGKALKTGPPIHSQSPPRVRVRSGTSVEGMWNTGGWIGIMGAGHQEIKSSDHIPDERLTQSTSSVSIKAFFTFAPLLRTRVLACSAQRPEQYIRLVGSLVGLGQTTVQYVMPTPSPNNTQYIKPYGLVMSPSS